MASGATTKRTTKKKLMPWEGGEPEYVELPERTPEQQASLDEFFEARRRGYMTRKQMWLCVMKAHEIRSPSGKIYRY